MTGTLAIKFYKYFEIVKITYNNNTTYIGDTLGFGGLVAMRVWIFVQLYRLAFDTIGASQIGGLNLAQTIWILALAQCFHVSNRTRKIMKQIDYEVKTGNVANAMVKPYNYVLFYFYSCFGVIGGNLFVTVFFTILTSLLVVGSVPVGVIGITAGILLLFLGFVLNNLAILIVGMLGFWTESIDAYRWIYDKFLWILGGIFLPLTIFPDKIQTIVELLPFNHMFYGPARIMIDFSPAVFIKYLAIQVAWIIIFSIILNFVYRKGTKNLSINGG